MKKRIEAFEIVCDCCGQVFHNGDDMVYFCDDPDGSLIEQQTLESNWKKMADGKRFCDDCWQWDDDDNIVTNDGHKYDGETCKEITWG